MFKSSFLLGATLWYGLCSVVAQSPAERLIRESRPLVIGHRGFSAAAPENTLPSFRWAMAAGADLVELDYHVTRDGQMIVIHDSTLDRTTDGTNRFGSTGLQVSGKTLAELSGLDAGAWYRRDYAGAKLPTLEAALDVIQAGGMTLIERKAGDAKGCVELIRRKGLLNRVIVQAFDWEYLADYHRLEPSQVLGALGPWKSFKGQVLTDEEKELSPRWVEEARKVGASAVVWNKSIRREGVDHAHRLGMKVWVYTINDPAVANTVLDLGVDGIISDNPAQTWRTLALRTVRTSETK